MQRADVEEIDFDSLNEITFYENNIQHYHPLVTLFAQNIIYNSRKIFSEIDIAVWMQTNKNETNDFLRKYSNNFGFCIILDVLKYDTHILRMLAIEKWIAIMQVCFDAQDFSSAQMIYSAITSTELNRLRIVISDISQERLDHIDALFFGGRETKQVSVEMTMEGCVPFLAEQIRQTSIARESAGSEEFIGKKVEFLKKLQEKAKALLLDSQDSQTESHKEKANLDNLLWKLVPKQQQKKPKKVKGSKKAKTSALKDSEIEITRKIEEFKIARMSELKDFKFEITSQWIKDFYEGISELYKGEEETTSTEGASTKEENSKKEKISWNDLLWSISERRQAKGALPDVGEKDRMIKLSKKINKAHQKVKRDATGAQAFFYDFENKLSELHKTLFETDREDRVGIHVRGILGDLAKLAGLEDRRVLLFKALTPYRISEGPLLNENDLLIKLNELQEILQKYCRDTDHYKSPVLANIPAEQEDSTRFITRSLSLKRKSGDFTPIAGSNVIKRKDDQKSEDEQPGKTPRSQRSEGEQPGKTPRPQTSEGDGKPEKKQRSFIKTMQQAAAFLDGDLMNTQGVKKPTKRLL